MKVNEKKQNTVWLALFAMSLALMLWKLPYGFGGDDEGFYLTIANRLTVGDRLFTDEWHLSQLSSFFLYPFVCAFKAATGGTEGILLASRVMYFVCHSAASAAVYLRLKKYGALSVLGSVFFLIFTPFDMMTCSYNTIAIDALALCGAFAASYEREADMITAGVFLACAVVCCPYLAAAYFFYALVCAAYRALYRRSGKKFFSFRPFSLKALGYVTVGAGIVFALFVIFLLSHTSVKEITESLPGLFSDPEHPSYSVVYMLKHYVYCIVTSRPYVLVPVGLYAASLALLAFDKNRKKHTLLYVSISAAAAAIWLLLFIAQLIEKNFNGIVLPLLPLGFTAYLLLENKPRAVFDFVFLLGVFYSVCVCSTSNMGYDILVIGFSVVNIANLIFIGMLIEERAGKREKRVFSAVCFIPVALLCAMMLTVKINHCFWDASPAVLDSRLESGPAKGIITNAYFKSSYDSISADMSEYAGEDGSILIYSQQAWEYLIPDMPYASFSAWLSGLDEKTDARLALYFSMNPQKMPEHIYIPKTSAFGELNIPPEKIYSDAGKYGYEINENEISYKLSHAKD